MEVLATTTEPDDAGGSADRFGYEWAHYSNILPESRIQLERWLGSTGLPGFRDKRVLDVGCGMGRNPYWMATVGAKAITCIDADERCVELTRANLSGFPGITVAQASVYHLTSADFGQYDRVTRIGVLMILADPRAALERMWQWSRRVGISFSGFTRRKEIAFFFLSTAPFGPWDRGCRFRR